MIIRHSTSFGVSMGSGFKRLHKVDEVLKLVLPLIKQIEDVEVVGVAESLGRVLAEDVESPVDIPPFDRAAVDGYAVRAEDTYGASPSNPIILKLIGSSTPSKPFIGEVKRGEAVEISTGAPLPRGANAVVPYEESKGVGSEVEVYRSLPSYVNVSRRGEDLRVGDVICRQGVRVRPWDVGLMASAGIKEVRVYRRPIVAIISTGEEVVELEEYKPSKGSYAVVNSTKYVLEGLVKELGGIPKYLGVVGDDVDDIGRVVAKGLEVGDMVLTTGGSSVGRTDYTVKALEGLKPELLIHGLAIRPGKPTCIAVVRGKPVIALSGFPVAALVGFEALAKPILLHMMHTEEEPRPVVKARLTRRLPGQPGVRVFARVRVFRVGGEYYAEPLAVTGSGVLSTLARGNGILIIPEDVEGFDEGDLVDVLILRRPKDEG